MTGSRFGSTYCSEQYLAGSLVYGYGADQSFSFTIPEWQESLVLLAGRSLSGFSLDLDGTDFGRASDVEPLMDSASLNKSRQ